MREILFICSVLLVADFSCHKDRNFYMHKNQNSVFTDYRDTILGVYYGNGMQTVNGAAIPFSDSVLISKEGSDSILIQSMQDTNYAIAYAYPQYLQDKSSYTLTYVNHSGNYICIANVHFGDARCDIFLDRMLQVSGYSGHRTLAMFKIHR